jgi:hypothetical protein
VLGLHFGNNSPGNSHDTLPLRASVTFVPRVIKSEGKRPTQAASRPGSMISSGAVTAHKVEYGNAIERRAAGLRQCNGALPASWH